MKLVLLIVLICIPIKWFLGPKLFSCIVTLMWPVLYFCLCMSGGDMSLISIMDYFLSMMFLIQCLLLNHGLTIDNKKPMLILNFCFASDKMTNGQMNFYTASLKTIVLKRNQDRSFRRQHLTISLSVVFCVLLIFVYFESEMIGFMIHSEKILIDNYREVATKDIQSWRQIFVSNKYFSYSYLSVIVLSGNFIHNFCLKYLFFYWNITNWLTVLQPTAVSWLFLIWVA